MELTLYSPYLWIFAGVLFQFMLLVRHHRWYEVVISLFLPLLLFLPFITVDLSHKLFGYVVITSLIYAVFTNKRLIPYINKANFIVTTLSLTYVIFALIAPLYTTEIGKIYILLGILAICVIGVARSGKGAMSLPERTTLFRAYLTVSTILVLLQFTYGTVGDLYRNNITSYAPATLLLIGMTMAYLETCIVIAILYLRGVRGEKEIILQKVDFRPLPFKEMLLLVILQGGSYLLNTFYNFISPGILLNFWIVFLPTTIALYYNVRKLFGKAK